jgi:hypothetical protein
MIHLKIIKDQKNLLPLVFDKATKKFQKNRYTSPPSKILNLRTPLFVTVDIILIEKRFPGYLGTGAFPLRA